MLKMLVNSGKPQELYTSHDGMQTLTLYFYILITSFLLETHRLHYSNTIYYIQAMNLNKQCYGMSRVV